MSEATGQPQDATAALQELEDQLAAGGKKGKAPSGIDAATAVAAAAATAARAPAPAPAAPAARKEEHAEPDAPKKTKARRVFFEGGPSRRLTALRGWITELVQSLGHTDYPTRRGARLFFASILGLMLVLGVAGNRYWSHLGDLRSRAAKVARAQNAVLSEFLRKRAEIAHRKNSMMLLGSFSLALQPEPGSRTPGANAYRLAEVELVVECDSKESRDFLEEHLAQARNEVTNTFVRVDREELMSAEGKARMKRALQERLNLMLPKGRVEGVFFSRLVLT